MGRGSAPTTTANVGQDSTPLLAGRESELAPLQRPLGAYGHLVVIREGDLVYLPVHPEFELVDGLVRFWLTMPDTGRYRAFFDFLVDGVVRTAEYTIALP